MSENFIYIRNILKVFSSISWVFLLHQRKLRNLSLAKVNILIKRLERECKKFKRRSGACLSENLQSFPQINPRQTLKSGTHDVISFRIEKLSKHLL